MVDPTVILLLLCAIPLQHVSQQGAWKKQVEVIYDEDGGNWSSAMASMGDLDHDGVRELIVGAFSSSIAHFTAGAVFVYSGRTGALLRTFTGENAGDGLGLSVTNAGDLDRDGYDDILAGAPFAEPFGVGVGAAYAYSGRTGQLLFRFTGSQTTFGRMGEAVAGVSDLNLDGWPDVAVGEPNAAALPGADGVVWVFSGRDGSVLKQFGAAGHSGLGSAILSLPDLDGDTISELLSTIGGGVGIFSGATGAVLREHRNSDSFAAFGQGQAVIGDFNGDAVPEYAVGAPYSGSRRGHVYVYDGATGALRYELIGENGASFGWSVAGPGDCDGDGYPEILVGAWQENYHRISVGGAAHLFSGFDGRRLMSFEGDRPRPSYIGISVSDIGDVNGDGLADLAIGSATTPPGTDTDGVLRVYALHSYLNLSTLALSAAAGGTVDFTLDFPDRETGRRYGLFASTGTGRTKVDGLWLPLRRTAFLEQMVLAPPPAFTGARGILDAAGDATASLTLAPGQAAPFLGRTVKFTAVSFEPGGGVGLFSAAMPLTIGS